MSWLYSLPVIGSLAYATVTVLQRTVLKNKNIKIKKYQPVEFLAVVIAMLPFIWFLWRIDTQAFELTNILILGVIVIFSIIANLFMYYSMKWEKISNLEPAKVLEPLFIILLAIVFSFIFGETLYERNLKIIIPALIAGVALILSHIKKHHISFNKYFIAGILASLFFAVELALSRLILDFYSPLSFYFVRCLAIFIITLLIFRPKLDAFKQKTKIKLLIMGFLFVFYRIIVYYGYVELGVIFTTLIIMLGPIFMYGLAWKFLGDKPSLRNIVAAGVIVLCVLYAIVF